MTSAIQTPLVSTIQDQVNKSPSCSKFRAIYILMVTAIGVGILELPKAMSTIGIIPAVLCLILSAFICGYQVKLFVRTISICNYPTYEGVAKQTVGVFGKNVMRLMINFTLFGILVMFAILTSSNIGQLFAVDSNKVLFYYTFVLFGICIIRSFNSIGIISMICIGSILTTCLCLGLNGVFLSVKDPSGRHHDMGDVDWIVLPLDLVSIGTSFATYSVSFGVTTVVPQLCSEIQSPKFESSQYAVNRAFLSITLLYLFISIASYVAYGSILSSAGSVLDVVGSHSLFGLVITGAVTVTSVGNFLCLFQPISRSIEDAFTSTRFGQSFNCHKINFILIRWLLVLLVVLVAYSVPTIKPLVSLLGAVTVNFIITIFPSISFIRALSIESYGKVEEFQLCMSNLYRDSKFNFIFISTSLILSLFTMVFGTVGALKEFS